MGELLRLRDRTVVEGTVDCEGKMWAGRPALREVGAGHGERFG